MLMDMNSTNGTFVNSQRIKDQVVVHNDIISIGNHQIKYIAPSGIHSGKPD
jgi:pSer/pThr/pTyr-binding forkhead associated (FHA) protein